MSRASRASSRAAAPRPPARPAPAAPRGAATRKGERTRERILDHAEALFAERGFEGASLREIARRAGIREPGLYNYFSGKPALYEAVLERGLRPLADELERRLAADAALAELPAVMTDLLLAHPPMAALFQRALQGDAEAPGHRLVLAWLDRLFAQGVATLRAAGLADADRADLAIRTIAMFNLTTGFFLAERAYASMAPGRLLDPDNVERQKRLLARVVRALGPD